jgi:hypothetical protein
MLVGIDERSSFLVPLRDAQALAVALRSLIDIRAARRNGPAFAGNRFGMFYREQVVTETLAVYWELTQ